MKNLLKFLIVVFLGLLMISPICYHYISGEHRKERAEFNEKLDELIDHSYFIGQQLAMDGKFYIKKNDNDTNYTVYRLWTDDIKWYTSKRDKNLYKLSEMAFYLGQKDYLDGRIFIEKLANGSYRWVGSPWTDRQPKYQPESELREI